MTKFDKEIFSKMAEILKQQNEKIDSLTSKIERMYQFAERQTDYIAEKIDGQSEAFLDALTSILKLSKMGVRK